MVGSMKRCLVLLVACVAWAVAKPAPNTIVMTMIIRDEEVNIRSNLPLWQPIIDYFVFMVDNRTQDNTVQAIQSILDGKTPYKIIPNEFDGFGPSRTRSLEAAWEHFPQATHVWIADPDWRPEVRTIRKSDLNLEADAFRFLVYDRNGVSTRRCDWLLRHRKGLAMRYHLHEVLHIGERYNWKIIEWVLREVEQSGSWHTTVGHGHSMSAQRYLFDLSLLEKDLAMYGHDPHTHYYLGVTHEAFAEKHLKGIGAYDKAVEHHVRESIKYLTLRSEATYRDEFPEERWASMYMLGNVHYYFLNDFLSAEHWYHMCHEFSPKQPECMYGLGKLSLSFGLLGKAFKAMKKLVTMQYEERSMLNHFREWACNVPSFAIEVLLHVSRLLPDEFAVHDIKYVRLLVEMVKQEQCASGNIRVPEGAESSLEQLARTHSVQLPPHQTQEKLCRDPALRQHIKDKKYTLHPCEDLKREIAREQTCRAFVGSHAPPPYEGFQIQTFDEYIGAAVVPDIVHHVYGGDASAVLAGSGKGKFRMLFAEHFSMSNVFNLVSVTTKDMFDVEVTVLTTPNSIRSMRDIFTVCNLQLASRVTFVALKANKTYAESLGVQQVGSGYDYIEYNGGASWSLKYVSELDELRKLLSSRGSIGVTFFSENHHLEAIRRALRNVNASAHPPFSVEPERLTKQILESRGLSRYATDSDLLSFLSDVTQRGFSREDISDLMSSLGMRILSWLPSAYSHPYDELPHHSVQVFRSHGMSEKDVVESIIGGFRYTVYVSADNAEIVHGRLRLKTLDDDVNIVDRKDFEIVFEHGEVLAAAGESLTLTFSAPLMNRVVFEVVLLPNIVAAFSMIQRGSVRLQDMAERAIRDCETEESIVATLRTFQSTLHTFESLNLISYWRMVPPVERVRGAASHHLSALEIHQSYSHGNVETVATSITAMKHQPSTWHDLMTSVRNPDCAHITEDNLPCHNWKNFQEDSQRYPSSISTTTAYKLKFDILQLAFISGRNMNVFRHLINDAIPHLEELYATIDHLPLHQAVQIDKKSRYLNRVTNLHHNVTIPHILYSDVLLYFKSISTVLEHNDFVVIDDVIPPSVLTVTVAMLQQSTIWFDISNGMSYFAHDNESLIFQAFHQLSKELCDVLSAQYQGIEVQNYFAVAMTETLVGTSPLISGTGDVITVILWLHIHDSHGAVSIIDMKTCEENEDALMINGDGIWTTNDDLDAPVASCQEGESVPGMTNRMIVLAPGYGVSFRQLKSSKRRRSFDDSVMLALVYRFAVPSPYESY